MKKALLVIMAVTALLLLAACGKKPASGDDATVADKPDEPTGVVTDSVFGADTPETTAPTQTTEPTQAPTETAKPSEPAGDSTTPTQPATEPAPTAPGSADEVDVESVDYGQFMAMTAAQQQAFSENFETPEAFFAWLTKKKEAYMKENPSIEIDSSGTVNMEDLLN